MRKSCISVRKFMYLGMSLYNHPFTSGHPYYFIRIISLSFYISFHNMHIDVSFVQTDISKDISDMISQAGFLI